MLDPEIMKDLHQKLSSGDAGEQAQSALHIRDLCAEKEEYRASLGTGWGRFAGCHLLFQGSVLPVHEGCGCVQAVS